tara:strand:+ start:1875 stop:2465 length:591 start_codon:yes stop_codon:yes gene_type:complete
MEGNHEEYQKALRISRAIQEHLEQINLDGLRSTDLYPVLARKKLIERDKDKGSKFRSFLRQLKNRGALGIIPQCKPIISSRNPNHIEWYFYRTKQEASKTTKSSNNPIIVPKLPEEEINILIAEAKEFVEKLPKKDKSKLSLPELELQELYERAYEIWSPNEIRLMNRAFELFGRVDKVAELLKRQPSAVRRKLDI